MESAEIRFLDELRGQILVAAREGRDREGYAMTNAGPSRESVEWFRDHDVAAVATDNPTFEYVDFELGRRDVLSAGWPEMTAIVGELTGDAPGAHDG